MLYKNSDSSTTTMKPTIVAACACMCVFKHHLSLLFKILNLAHPMHFDFFFIWLLLLQLLLLLLLYGVDADVVCMYFGYFFFSEYI